MSDTDDPTSPDNNQAKEGGESQESLSREEIVKKLSSECTEADWNMLKPHYTRGALVNVSKNLNLFEVGAAIALDEANKLEEWMKDGLVHQVTPKEAEIGEQDPYKKSYKFVIVQPYVFIQRV